MDKSSIYKKNLSIALTALTLAMAPGCAMFGNSSAEGETTADGGPSRYVDGMPPSATPPTPAWFAERFGRVRGVGEALQQNRRALWDNEARAFAYYIGGVLYAQYHPWQHDLRIRSDDGTPLNCLWTPDGTLQIEGASEQDMAQATASCNALLGILERRVNNQHLQAAGDS